MFSTSFSKMVAVSGAALWLIITAGLYSEFGILMATLISIPVLFIIWRIARFMAPLAHEGTGGKALLVFWLVITATYIGTFDSMVALFFIIFIGMVVWSCSLHMVVYQRDGCFSGTDQA